MAITGADSTRVHTKTSYKAFDFQKLKQKLTENQKEYKQLKADYDAQKQEGATAPSIMQKSLDEIETNRRKIEEQMKEAQDAMKKEQVEDGATLFGLG